MAEPKIRLIAADGSVVSSSHTTLDGGGDGPQNPGMEARVAKLEAIAEHIQRDLADVRSDVRSFRSDVKADFKDIRVDLKEVRAQHRVDFLILAGMVITVALGLAGIMAKGFKWL